MKFTTVLEDPGPWSLYIYGDWGSGKTVFAARAKGALLCDVERGRRSLLNHPELHNVPIFPVGKFADLRQLVLELSRSQNEEIETVIIDTVTELQEKDIIAQMKVVGKQQGRDPDLPSQAEFNKNNRRVAKMIKELIDMTNKNVLLLGHVKEEKDDEGMTTLIRPGTSPSLTNTLARVVDGVFYLDHRVNGKGEVERTLKTVPTRKLKAKNRFGNLPPEIKDPHISMIEEAANKQRQLALELMTKETK